jgi:hypothetical protein
MDSRLTDGTGHALLHLEHPVCYCSELYSGIYDERTKESGFSHHSLHIHPPPTFTSYPVHRGESNSGGKVAGTLSRTFTFIYLMETFALEGVQTIQRSAFKCKRFRSTSHTATSFNTIGKLFLKRPALPVEVALNLMHEEEAGPGPVEDTSRERSNTRQKGYFVTHGTHC